MMKSLLLALFLCFPIFLPAQDTNRKHIPGTKCSIEVRDGFVLSKRFRGLEHTSGKASIMFSDIPSSLELNKKVFTEEEIKKKGMTMVAQSEVTINGVKMLQYEVTQMNKEVKLRKYILLFGDTSASVFINSMAPDSNAVLCQQMKALLSTVIYKADFVEDPEEVMGFTIDLSSTDFKLAKSAASGFIYTRDGLLPTKTDDKASFTTAVSASNTRLTDKKDFVFKRLKSLPGVDSLLQYAADTISVDGLHGYAAEARILNKSKKEELIYLVVFFKDQDGCAVLSGRTSGEFDKYRTSFRTIVASLRQKK